MLAFRALLISLSQTAAKLGELLVAILLVRLLRPDEWASIALLLSFYTAALGLAGFGLPEGMLFFLGRLPASERRRFLAQTTALLGVTGAVAAGIILGLAPLLAGSRFEVAEFLPLLALTVLLEVPALAAPQLLVAEERVRAAAVYYAGSAVLRLGAVIVPILLGFGVRGAMVGVLFSASIRFLLYLALIGWLTPAGPVGLRWSAVREQIAFTAPLGLAVCINALNTGLGKWFVALWAPSQLGAFAIAATQVPIVPVLAAATGTVLATRMVHAFRHSLIEQAAAYWQASTARMALLVAPITVAIILGAAPLQHLLFGDRYPAAVLPFQIYTLILLHRLADHGTTLRAAGDTRALWRASLLFLSALLWFGIPLTLRFGMVGAAVGMVAAQLASWLYMLSRIARALGRRLGTVLPWRLYAAALLLSGAAAAGAALVSGLGPPAPLPQLLLRWTAFMVCFAAGARAFRLRRRLPAIPEDHASFRTAAAA